MALFAIGIKNYQRESQRNFMQKEINFMADNLGNQIKQAADSPDSYGLYTRSSDVLILALPAINEDEDFIYSGGDIIYDYVVYYLQNGSLYKKIIADDQSYREDKEEPVLPSVIQFECIYTPQEDTELVSCTIGTTQNVDGTSLSFTATKTARMRNHQ